jgi:hypothetical protein
MGVRARIWRLLLVGLAMVIAARCAAQAPDLFQSAPGPVAPKPKPRPHAPPPEVAPAPPEPTAVPRAGTPPASPSANAPLARPAGMPSGAFDGAYTGTVTMAMPATTPGHHRNCLPGAPVRMIIGSSTVLIEQGGRPEGGTANYRGTVDAGGAVSAAAANLDGTVHTVSGKISQARFTGQLQRTGCTFSVELVKG